MFNNFATVCDKDTLIVKGHSKVDESIKAEEDGSNDCRGGPVISIFHIEGPLQRSEESIITNHDWCDEIPKYREVVLWREYLQGSSQKSIKISLNF